MPIYFGCEYRMNEAIGSLYQPLHPGVIRLIKHVMMLAMNKANSRACVVSLLVIFLWLQ